MIGVHRKSRFGQIDRRRDELRPRFRAELLVQGPQARDAARHAGREVAGDRPIRRRAVFVEKHFIDVADSDLARSEGVRGAPVDSCALTVL
jgi:hypothetical protein